MRPPAHRRRERPARVCAARTLEVRLSDSFDLSALLDEYRDEAESQLARLDAALLALEESGSLPEPQRAALVRALHTLKGNSGMLGLNALVDRIHAIESLFKDDALPTGQDELDRLFEAAAALRRAVERVGTEGEAEALQRLETVQLLPPAAGGEAAAPPSPEATGASSPPRHTGAEPAVPAERPLEDAETGLETTSEMLRVPFSKLDALLNRVGEMLSTVAALEQLAEEGRETLPTEMRRTLEERVEVLQSATDAVRSATMDLRLVPIGRLFSRFPSLARDLARQQGKRVRVEISGEDVELDKSTVDALGEPLLHLVRNAVDHGIATPGEREAAGRPPTGTLWLRAEQRGDRVDVEVTDDGHGLDRDAILARARQMELIPPGARPAEVTVEELIFAPGFSTRSEATTVSGRGVGLDVVRRGVTRMRGSLSVQQRPGGGTRFHLQLPLTVAIVPALVLRAHGEVLAVPAAEVVETLRRVPLERAGAAEVVRFRDQLVPALRLPRVFGWEWTEPEGPPTAPFAVILRRATRFTALLADRLLEQRSLVVKAAPPFLGALPAVSGTTVAPDGRVILLLDVGGLLELNLDPRRRNDRAGEPTQGPDR